MQLIDTHAHLTDGRFQGDLPQVLTRAEEAGISAIINVGFDLASSQAAMALAKLYPRMYTAVGIHPHDAQKATCGALQTIRSLAGQGSAVAIGEIGLDYHYNHSSASAQIEAFRQQLRLARELALPVIVHDRDAHEEVLAILRQEAAGVVTGVMHCFSGNADYALRCVDLGFYISLAGPVTFKNAGDLPAVAKVVPTERLVLETDAPYLAPVPYRGQRNEPAYVRAVAQKIAEIREMPLTELANATTANAIKLFDLANNGQQ